MAGYNYCPGLRKLADGWIAGVNGHRFPVVHSNDVHFSRNQDAGCSSGLQPARIDLSGKGNTMLLKLRGATVMAAIAVAWAGPAVAQHVPGTGSKSTAQADDFEMENWQFIYNMPFRAIGKMSNGVCSSEMVDGIVDVVNGSLLRGLRKVAGGYFRNRRANKQTALQFAGKK